MSHCTWSLPLTESATSPSQVTQGALMRETPSERVVSRGVGNISSGNISGGNISAEGGGLCEGERIVMISSAEATEAMVRRLEQARALMGAELGSVSFPPTSHAFLAISHSARLIGVAVAEPIEGAYRAEVPATRGGAVGGSTTADTGEVYARGGSEGDAPTAAAGSDAQAAAGCDASTAAGSDASTARARSGGGGVDGAEGGEEGGGQAVLRHDGVFRRATCGISHIWVASAHRRRGVARALLDAARRHLASSFEVPLEELAFSQPTAQGRALAAAYVGEQQFLVYS